MSVKTKLDPVLAEGTVVVRGDYLPGERATLDSPPESEGIEGLAVRIEIAGLVLTEDDLTTEALDRIAEAIVDERNEPDGDDYAEPGEYLPGD